MTVFGDILSLRYEKKLYTPGAVGKVGNLHRSSYYLIRFGLTTV